MSPASVITDDEIQIGVGLHRMLDATNYNRDIVSVIAYIKAVVLVAKSKLAEHIGPYTTGKSC